MVNATGVILAGGKSKRMNTNKALIQLGNKTIIERVMDELSSKFENIILVTNENKKYIHLNKKIINDVYPGLGAVAGIHAALFHERENPYIFVAGCDMPFIKGDLASYLLSLAPGYDVVVPCVGNYLQPLAAVYSVLCLPVMDAHLKSNKLKIKYMFSELNVRYVSEREIASALEVSDITGMFININTPADLKHAWVHLKQGDRHIDSSNARLDKKLGLGGEMSAQL